MYPKVTLIIPVYNVEKYLIQCLNSAINQTLKEIEIIVVNDGSTDNSLKIIEQFVQKDNRIKVFTQENKGLGFARNLGIEKATGEFIFCLDSDDWIELDTLEKLYKKTQIEKSDVVICGWKRVEEESGKTLATRTDINTLENTFKETILKRVFSGKMNLMTSACLIHKSIFDEHHIIYPDVYHEDLYVTPKIYYYAKKISIEKDCLYNWLSRENSITANINIKHAVGICGAINDLKIFLHKEKVFKKYQYQFVQFTFAYIHTLLKKTNIDATDDDKIKIHKLVSETLLNIPELENYEKVLSISDKKAYVETIVFYVISLNSTKKNLITEDDNSLVAENTILKIEKDHLVYILERKDKAILGKESRLQIQQEKMDKMQKTINDRDKAILGKESQLQIQQEKIKQLNEIKKAKVKVISIKTLWNPIKKYKAYKKLIKEIK